MTKNNHGAPVPEFITSNYTLQPSRGAMIVRVAHNTTNSIDAAIALQNAGAHFRFLGEKLTLRGAPYTPAAATKIYGGEYDGETRPPSEGAPLPDSFTFVLDTQKARDAFIRATGFDTGIFETLAEQLGPVLPTRSGSGRG
jgi:hypothetical protein